MSSWLRSTANISAVSGVLQGLRGNGQSSRVNIQPRPRIWHDHEAEEVRSHIRAGTRRSGVPGVLVCGVLAEPLTVGQPVLQLTAGILMIFLPALRSVEFPPEAALLLFLILLYGESVNPSLREIRRNLRRIVN